MSKINRKLAKEWYIERRQLLSEKMSDQGAAIIASATPKVRNFDSHFPYRQESNFYYLTGLNEPESVLVLIKNKNEIKTALFLRAKNPLTELWDGKMLGVDDAKTVMGIDMVFPIENLETELPGLLLGSTDLYLDIYGLAQGEKTGLTRVFRTLPTLSRSRKSKLRAPARLCDVNVLIGELRLIKTLPEIELMKTSAGIANRAHRAAMAMAKPGFNENQIEGIIEGIYRLHGAYGNAYRSIVAGGENALCLHYIENNSELKDGDLLLIDAGCDVGYYASDVTRTFPINGKFTSAQKEIYELVLKSQVGCIEKVAPGRSIKDNHDTTIKILTQGMIDLKILTGSLEKNIEDQSFAKYFPHGTGHWIGLDVHDNSPYLDLNNEQIKFEAGMVFTVEPGLYFPTNDMNVPEQYRGIGIRIEDDILVTSSGYENLTKMIPKEIADVEAACQQDYRDFLI